MATVLPFPSAAETPAFRAALDAIDREFSRPNQLALGVARAWLRRGFVTDMQRVAFGWLADLVRGERIGLSGAVALMGCYARMAGEMRKAGQRPPYVVHIRGAVRGIPELDIKAIRFTLRWMRRYRRDEFAELLDTLAEPVERRRPTVHIATDRRHAPFLGLVNTIVASGKPGASTADEQTTWSA